MRVSIAMTCAALIGLTLITARRADESCTVTLTLTDAQTGIPIPGILRIKNPDGENLALQELLPRGLGVGKVGIGPDNPINSWSVIAKPTALKLPASKLTVETFSGLEYETATVTVDLSGKTTENLTIPLQRFYNAAQRGFRSANTHLHLMKISRQQADRYLKEVPRADGLDIVFLSYLERVTADREYISNKYNDADLARMTKDSGTGFGNGEEHRHNFSGGDGYGHVMLLNIKKLILPVSIGPGIMKSGTDGIPIQRGIDTARGDGATIVWCHNDQGLEDLANVATGRLDAQNIFDGGVSSSYKHTFYRYLNAGFQIPFSTGTDWFMYDFSRVYVDAGKYVTPQQWLQGLSSGKSYITNGPLLEFTVNGQKPGDTIAADNLKSLSVVGRGWGRLDFGKLELVQNGRVIHSADARKENGHFTAELNFTVDASKPCWLALRTPAPPLRNDPELTEPVHQNEFGRDLFAHTSALYVTVGGRRYFDRTVAEGMIRELRESRDTISAEYKFADDQARARVLDVYTDALAAMNQHIQKSASKEK